MYVGFYSKINNCFYANSMDSRLPQKPAGCKAARAVQLAKDLQPGFSNLQPGFSECCRHRKGRIGTAPLRTSHPAIKLHSIGPCWVC